MKRMRAGAVIGVTFDDNDSGITQCEVCAKGKQTKRPFKPSETESSEILELIYTAI